MTGLLRIVDALFGRGQLFATRMAILAISLGLSVLGILFVHSATSDEFEAFPSADASAQIVKLGIGLAVLLVVMAIDSRTLERVAYSAYFAVLLVLGALLALKHTGGETISRWIRIGFVNVQPSEVMKIIVVLALARYLRFRKDQRRLSGLARPFLLTLIPMFLIVAQPDLGTSLMLPPILLALLFVAGARRLHLAVALVAGLALVPTMLVLHTWVPEVSGKILKDYQMRRLVGYVWRDERSWAGVNYQLRQSLVAFGSGGVGGKGYHEGTQNILGFLPAKHTDFIFPVIGEELGLVGAGTAVLAYWILVLCILHVAMKTREPFARLVVSGVAALFAAQGFENFGMTLGLTPITGLPLPFVSFGGSSLVTSFIGIGIVVGIAARPVRVVASPDFQPHEDAGPIAVVDDHPSGANLFPNSPY